jgi:hypothetical protein
MSRQALNLQFRQSNHHKHLAACDQELRVFRSDNGKSAPESASLKALQFAMNQEFVPKLSRPSIVDFRSDNYGAVAVIEHLVERPAEFFRKQRTICLNEPEISDIMDHTARVGVEKHHLNFGL